MPENSGKRLSPGQLREFRRGKNTKLKAELFRYLEGSLRAEQAIAGMDLAPPDAPAALPRHIWMYWHDGWENAPEIAKLCLQSWRLRNPGYEIRALDYASLGTALADPPVHHGASKLSGFANRVRLRLLRTHGGIWADATNFCTKPIDPWIHDHVAASRLFAFTLPNAERPIATWFLAAAERAPLMAAWEHLVSLYFERVEREGRRVHAYFFMPYIFEFAVSKNEQLRAQWEGMPKVPVGAIGRVSLAARLLQPGDPPPSLGADKRATIAALLAGTPMQKLTWKGQVREGTAVAGQVLDILRQNLAVGSETAAPHGPPDR